MRVIPNQINGLDFRIAKWECYMGAWLWGRRSQAPVRVCGGVSCWLAVNGRSAPLLSAFGHEFDYGDLDGKRNVVPCIEVAVMLINGFL